MSFLSYSKMKVCVVVCLYVYLYIYVSITLLPLPLPLPFLFLFLHPIPTRTLRVHPPARQRLPCQARHPQVVHHRGLPRPHRLEPPAAVPGAARRLGPGGEGLQRPDGRRRRGWQGDAGPLRHGQAEHDHEGPRAAPRADQHAEHAYQYAWDGQLGQHRVVVRECAPATVQQRGGSSCLNGVVIACCQGL